MRLRTRLQQLQPSNSGAPHDMGVLNVCLRNSRNRTASYKEAGYRVQVLKAATTCRCMIAAQRFGTLPVQVGMDASPIHGGRNDAMHNGRRLLWAVIVCHCMSLCVIVSELISSPFSWACSREKPAAPRADQTPAMLSYYQPCHASGGKRSGLDCAPPSQGDLSSASRKHQPSRWCRHALLPGADCE